MRRMTTVLIGVLGLLHAACSAEPDTAPATEPEQQHAVSGSYLRTKLAPRPLAIPEPRGLILTPYNEPEPEGIPHT